VLERAMMVLSRSKNAAERAVVAEATSSG
jgi:hypothetical protein